MASIAHSTPAPAQQPGLRAFIVCDRLPEGCVAYPVTNGWNEPHLSVGEWVVVDPTDCEPEHGNLFVVNWGSGRGPVMMITSWMPQMSCWAVAGTRPAFVCESAGIRHIAGGCIGDFGYRDEHLRRVICGRVVGILEVADAGPVRLAA